MVAKRTTGNLEMDRIVKTRTTVTLLSYVRGLWCLLFSSNGIHNIQRHGNYNTIKYLATK